ncbi:hypothetical protein ACN2MM_11025 [Alkalilimnicola ehrlichii MLHE-1]|uniref:Uncharacterized protein n=1 Tax=Alkalilimnicola ehrlichii (strain ATCC BAA-1101 / DSM 17681 / MLHE-1) TaxID=187272 RepID=Q0A6Z0_ALKEH|nr:hypothetical protein [Alkalilimnicola ehrlichii]ABI57397.1 hypothetical protein Mlg_2055 [Alkalilimnicola ehrlichii MLHE-1]
MVQEKKRSVIPPDRGLRILMKIGVPIGAISLLSLWLAYFTDTPMLMPLFLITALLAFAIGMAYNIRLVILMVRQKRQAERQQP